MNAHFVTVKTSSRTDCQSSSDFRSDKIFLLMIRAKDHISKNFFTSCKPLTTNKWDGRVLIWESLGKIDNSREKLSPIISCCYRSTFRTICSLLFFSLSAMNYFDAKFYLWYKWGGLEARLNDVVWRQNLRRDYSFTKVVKFICHQQLGTKEVCGSRWEFTPTPTYV